MTITQGIVSKLSVVSGTDYVVHSAKISEGNSGGPTVDGDGNVIGINQMGSRLNQVSENYFYAIATDVLIKTLDRLGVTYIKAGEVPAPTPNKKEGGDVVDEPQVDKSALKSALDKAASEDRTAYTKESADALDEAVKSAQSVYDDANATQTAVDNARNSVNEALGNLEEVHNPKFPIWLIALIAAAVIAIIVVLVLMTRNNKKPAARRASAPSTPPQMPPVPPVQPQPMSGPMGGGVPPMYGGGAGTSVLGGGSNETTVLSGGNETTVLSADYGTLTRVSTGEKVTISNERFVIGRERGRVDYCISDNTAVGRTHAIIVTRGGNAYVVDQNSRNCTYVNDVKAPGNQEVKIKSGDKITFADEAFTYNAH